MTNPKDSSHKPKDAANNHMGTKLVELNEPLIESLRSKKYQKCSKMMPKGPSTNI
jgi:hypothetical protein